MTAGDLMRALKLHKWLCLIGALAAVLPAAAHADAPLTPQQAQQAVKVRQADMDVQAYALAPVLRMLAGSRFDAAAAFRASSQLTVMMQVLRDVFATDTRKFSLKTQARRQIWSDPLAFELQLRDMDAAVVNMASAAMKGDESATLKATRAVVSSCRACHQRFAVGLQ
jgi:cytochrome c556